MKKETNIGNESVTNCNQLKLQSSDGKFYKVMNNLLNRLISMRYVYMVSAIAMLLILPNQNIFAQSSRKSSKILDVACIYKPNTSFLFKAVYSTLK